jgi:hypothetical protein
MNVKDLRVRQTNKKSGKVYVISSKEAIMYLTENEIRNLVSGKIVETQYNKFEVLS